ncbi:hypothetical protein NQZ68_039976 [Dissostichus eleginoides]|nr:hypothetical protein NQZ68_039976 [Dissostichus eleginoides]
MRTVILALMVLVGVSQGEILVCSCGGTSNICLDAGEPCGLNQVCTSFLVVVQSRVTFFRTCMTANACRLLCDTRAV